jgi:hypothetical protein
VGPDQTPNARRERELRALPRHEVFCEKDFGLVVKGWREHENKKCLNQLVS